MSRKSELMKRYGLTLEEYDAMLAFQDGRCYICDRKPRARDPRLAVDHDHRTGAIRGLLCAICNHDQLGLMSEDAGYYYRAWLYLVMPPAVQALGGIRWVPDAPPLD